MAKLESSVQPGDMAPYGKLPVPKLTQALMGLVRSGTVYSLAVMHYEGMQVPGPMVPYTLSGRIRHGDLKDIVPASAAAEIITMSAHTATHIDALCHVGEFQNADGEVDSDGEVHIYAGEGKTTPAATLGSYTGQQFMSIAEMPPIITRSILLDVAGYKGVSVLPENYAISVEDVQGTMANQETTLSAGTAVLVRTGYYQHLRDDNIIYRDSIAGLSLEAAQFLVEQGMILAGADTMSVEALPPMSHPVHRFLLVHNGITHLENVYLEELAAQRVYEFLLIVTPLRLLGATGSWVHPIAIA
jgi:kynurenine formamidase